MREHKVEHTSDSCVSDMARVNMHVLTLQRECGDHVCMAGREYVLRAPSP